MAPIIAFLGGLAALINFLQKHIISHSDVADEGAIKGVFISYAHEDYSAAKRLYCDLKKAGIDAWLDKECLLPGQNWKLMIKQAIRRSRYFIAILSTNSITNSGYFQKELAEAIDLLDELPKSRIFLLPIRINECNPTSEKISDLHRVDMFPSWNEGLNKIFIIMKDQVSIKNNVLYESIGKHLRNNQTIFSLIIIVIIIITISIYYDKSPLSQNMIHNQDTEISNNMSANISAPTLNEKGIVNGINEKDSLQKFIRDKSPGETVLERDGASLTDLSGVIPSYDSPGISFGDNFDLLMDSNRRDIRDLGASIVGYPGDVTIDKVCAIYDYLKNGNKTMKGWAYISDPLANGEDQYANETIKKGKEYARSGVGDCDDFAILMAALVEFIGATPRIVLADNGRVGHAYTEVYIGNLESKDNQVEEIIQWLRDKYLLNNVYVHIDPETRHIWLNLDWGPDSKGFSHPGGPFFEAESYRIIASRDMITPLRVNKIHITQSSRSILPSNSDKVRQLAQVGDERTIAKDVVWSPNGKLLAIASNGLYLYDTKTWRQSGLIDTGWIDSVAFSPDGKTLASAGRMADAVKLWDTASGGEKRSFDGISLADDVAFSPDGRILAVAAGMTVKLLDAENGREIDTLIGHRITSVNSVAFSPYGHILASGSQEIKLWDVSNGSELRTISGHENSIQSLAFSPYGLILASASVDNTVRLWDVASGSQLRVLTGHSSRVDGVSFSPDGRLVASASWDPSVKLWDVANGSDLRTLKGHTLWVTCVAFSPDGSMIASGSDDGTVRIWGLD